MVRISLIAGSYIPHFDFGSRERPIDQGRGEEHSSGDSPHESQNTYPDGVQIHFHPAVRRRWIIWSAAALLVFGAILALVRSDFLRSTNYLVWKPFLNAKKELIICVPDGQPILDMNVLAGTEPQTGTASIAPNLNPLAIKGANSLSRVLFMDAEVASWISNRLSRLGGAVVLYPSSSLSMRDFRQRPIVLVGGFNNPWSLMFLSKLRYSLFADAASGEKWIQDAQAPSKREWKIDGTPEQARVDYALITRFWNVDTGGWVMVVSGLGPFGTEGAASLLADPSLERLLPAVAGSAKNFQIVLKATLIKGSTGSPQILAVHTW